MLVAASTGVILEVREVPVKNRVADPRPGSAIAGVRMVRAPAKLVYSVRIGKY
jgi:hypothetical protein